jgi:hypothetical protein
MRTNNKSFKDVVQQRAGSLCLIGILFATFMHTTTFMSQFFYSSLVLGAVAAFAIDSGVVAMAIYKDKLRGNGQLAWMVRTVTVLVLFASGIANMSEGFKSAYGIALTIQSFNALDWLTIAQWLGGTIIFPIVGYIMTDVVGDHFAKENARLQKQQRETDDKRADQAKRPKKKVPLEWQSSSLNNDSLGPANNARYKTKAERMDALDTFLDENPEATVIQMAKAAGVSSRDTVYRYLDELGRR